MTCLLWYFEGLFFIQFLHWLRYIPGYNTVYDYVYAQSVINFETGANVSEQDLCQLYSPPFTQCLSIDQIVLLP